jgi:5-amino-6-(5-phosphoribosylamino)uracil reductase/diaminohydroxyphosphoribosylaminopyrimidine deaminase/5-amino-6-(5-phosphoribosylamino)uracil reductase
MGTTESGCPRVTLHYAQTLDGRIATRTGHARWISCQESLRLQHELRASHDAVLVGVGTAVADDPRLTVRLVEGRSPLRIVLDSTLRIPLDRAVLTDGAAPTVIATTARAPEGRVRAVRATGADVLAVGQDETGRVDLAALLRCLRARGVRSVMVEGGGTVITSLLRGRLVDRMIVCIAPKVIGEGIDAVNDLNVLTMADALTLTDTRFDRLGDDLIFEGRLSRDDRRATD